MHDFIVEQETQDHKVIGKASFAHEPLLLRLKFLEEHSVVPSPIELRHSLMYCTTDLFLRQFNKTAPPMYEN